MQREQSIPFMRLGIYDELRPMVVPEAPRDQRLKAASGEIGADDIAQLGICYLLAMDDDAEIKEAAAETVRRMPSADLVDAITQRSHTKVLEYVAVLRGAEQDIATKVYSIRNANDRTAIMIAEQAEPDLCERIAYERERMMITPQVILALHGNANCTDQWLDRAASFLRMHNMLPELPEERFAEPAPAEPAAAAMDLEAEIEAALMGGQSPALQERTQRAMELFDLDVEGEDDDLFGGFDFDFTDDLSNFSWDLTEEREDEQEEEERKSIEKKISEMTIATKVKLAHLGNKQVRTILVRDRNKLVAVAVIKSGRLTDGEVISIASNRNLNDDVMREVAYNREWLRKYPVKVALVNNPKTPPSVAVGLVSSMQKKDLMDLSRNHNIPSVVATAAKRLFKQKYRSEGQQKGRRG